MKVDLRSIFSFLALLCVLTAPAALRADTFTYTFADGGTPPSGTATTFSFSYTGTGLLALSQFLPTDTCAVTTFGTARIGNEAGLDQFGADDDRIKILQTGGNEYFVQLPKGFFTSTGVHTDDGGNTLTITDVASVSG